MPELAGYQAERQGSISTTRTLLSDPDQMHDRPTGYYVAMVARKDRQSPQHEEPKARKWFADPDSTSGFAGSSYPAAASACRLRYFLHETGFGADPKTWFWTVRQGIRRRHLGSGRW